MQYDKQIRWNQRVLYIYDLIRALFKLYSGMFYQYITERRIVLEEYPFILLVTTLRHLARMSKC